MNRHLGINYTFNGRYNNSGNTIIIVNLYIDIEMSFFVENSIYLSNKFISVITKTYSEYLYPLLRHVSLRRVSN